MNADRFTRINLSDIIETANMILEQFAKLGLARFSCIEAATDRIKELEEEYDDPWVLMAWRLAHFQLSEESIAEDNPEGYGVPIHNGGLS